MKNLIFGSGLIGSFLGGSLRHAGLDVSFLARERQKQAMRDGFTISALSGPQTKLPSPDFADQTQKEGFDIVWLTVKCTAVAESVQQIKNFIKEDSVIICCQNGFGSESIIKSSLPDTTVLNATVGFNVADQGNQHFHRSTDGSLVVESHEKINHILELLDQELIPAHITHKINAERWAKLQLNLANPVNALANIPTKAMTEDRDYRLVIARLMSELLEVTSRIDISLPKLTALPATWLPGLMRLPNFIYLKLAQKTLAIDPTARVSMWWDLSQNKKTEIDFLNGSVVAKAKELGIKCPANERITALIKEVESGEREIGISGKELQRLLGI